jgi:hypothetical protein
MTTKAAAAWDALNARQRLYLRTIFEFDQQAEVDIKRSSAKWMKTPPASEWRQITYDIALPKKAIVSYSSVQKVLRDKGEHDDGSGSTLAALRRRGLITITRDRVEVLRMWVPRIRVRLTNLGRAAARHGAGITTPAAPPKGLMARWSFAALARLYAAGERGLDLEAMDKENRAPSWKTLLNLRDRRDGSFIDEFGRSSVRLTAAARLHYEIHYACYRGLYPDIDATEPASVDGAHTGLADHQVRRPKHLLRDTDLRVLAALAELEATSTCYLRRVATEQYQRIGQAVPDEVRTIPPGLLRWQIKDLTRSEKPIDRLAAHPDGPLVEVVDAPNGPFHLSTRPTLPLVVLTQAGRDHLHDYATEYRRAYPELPLPSLPVGQ